MGQSQTLFRLFSSFSHSNYNVNNPKWKKRRWCAWDSNPGLHDGRRRQNHGARAAAQLCYNVYNLFGLQWLLKRLENGKLQYDKMFLLLLVPGSMGLPKWITPSARRVLAVMVFWGQIQNYMMRVNLSILIVAMIKDPDPMGTWFYL